MNAFFITIGTAIVLVLVAALVGPLFIDWTAYRATIEQQATRFLGTDVQVAGEADFRLLPSPRVRLTDVRLGPADRPVLEAEAVELDVQLTPLLSRQLHILDLRLDRPVATVRIERDGTVSVPEVAVDSQLASFFDRADVSVENITVDGGRIDIVDRRMARTTSIDGIALSGSARSLRGPFNASGTAQIGGAEQGITLSGGTLEEGQMPLSVRVVPAGDAFSLSFDGALTPDAAAPALRGETVVESTSGAPWSMRGTLSADTDAISLVRGIVQYGADPAPLEFAVAATYALTLDEPVAIAMEARQIDLDRLALSLGATAEAGPAPPRTIAPLLARHLAPVTAALGGAQAQSIPVLAEVDVGTIVAGGSIVRDVSAGYAADARGVRLDRFEALFPGETGITASGRLADGFFGTVRVSASQPAVLARWWSGETFVGGLMAPAIIETDVALEGGTLDAQRLSVRIGQTSASGRIRFTEAGADASVLDIALTASQLDAADVADVAALFLASGTGPHALPDILLDVAVDQMLMGDVAGSAVTMDGSFRDGTLTLDAFLADDLAGARVFASGTIGDLLGEPAGVIDGTITVSDGAQFAAALSAVLPPGRGAAALVDAARASAPADIRVSISGQPDDAGRTLALSLTGTLAGTSLDLTATGSPGPGWADAPLTLLVEADNDDAGTLAAQLGLSASPSDSPGVLAIDVSGTPAAGLEGTVRATGFGADAGFEGTLSLADGTLVPSGTFTLEATGFRALGDATGVSLPNFGAVSLAATLEPQPGGALSLPDLRGSLGGASVEGPLVVDGSGVEGAIALGAADLETLVSLVLGPDAWAAGEATGKPWPGTVFSDPLLPPLPLSLVVTTPSLRVGTAALEDVSFTLSSGPSDLTFDNISAGYAGGEIGGGISISRDSTRADLSASITLDNAAVADLAWQASDEPVASGTLSGAAAVTASGFTVSDLVSSLAGQGRFTVGEGRIRGLNPSPFDPIAQVINSNALPDEASVAAAFAEHLAGGDRDFAEVTGDLEIAEGTVRINDLSLTGAASAEAGLASAAIDFATWTLRSDWLLPVRSDGEADDAAPAVDLTFDGPLSAPQRAIDVAALVAWLNLQELENQVRAVEAQNEELEAEANAIAPALPENLGAPAPPAAAEEQNPAPDASAEPQTPPEDTTAPGDDERAAAQTPRDALGALDQSISEFEARQSVREDTIADLMRRLELGEDAPAPFQMRESDLVPASP